MGRSGIRFLPDDVIIAGVSPSLTPDIDNDQLPSRLLAEGEWERATTVDTNLPIFENRQHSN